LLERACAEHGARPLIVAETDNIESQRHMVEAGVGLALVPTTLTLDRSRWRAALVPLAGVAGRRVILVHRGTSYLTSAARALRDALHDAAARLTDPHKRFRVE